ncbi:MAG TPA: hypothetical protein PLZ05_00605 [Alphaproteobacteria bacterium]|nr:hypothetical protein [Alphaproteobacteria bacterium]
MPLRKKHTARNKIIIWILISILIVLMVISFPHAQNMTEIVLFS